MRAQAMEALLKLFILCDDPQELEILKEKARLILDRSKDHETIDLIKGLDYHEY